MQEEWKVSGSLKRIASSPDESLYSLSSHQRLLASKRGSIG